MATVSDDMVSFAYSAAQEAEHMAREAGCSVAEAKLAGSEAYKNAMPRLTSHGNARLHIACVAAGVAHGYIDGKQAKLMLYAAQLALAALRASRL